LLAGGGDGGAVDGEATLPDTAGVLVGTHGADVDEASAGPACLGVVGLAEDNDILDDSLGISGVPGVLALAAATAGVDTLGDALPATEGTFRIYNVFNLHVASLSLKR
jgi:hypothetical protein